LITIGLLSLILQALVIVTGSLVPAMVVHAKIVIALQK
jgi:hypothetical protein